MPELLRISHLCAGYGEAVVLADVTAAVGQGETLALLGRNGMGKSTLINSIIGVTRRFGGSIALDGRDITRLRPDHRALAGIGWVPQERRIFRSLTVEENLTAVARPGRWSLGRVYAMFPRLHERRKNLGGQLSGGEQQMLAIGRALIGSPRILLLDEPLEGLAPIIVDELLAVLRQVIREEGLATLIVEQNVRKVLAFTDRVAVIERGAIVYECDGAVVRADQRALDGYLGLEAKHTTPRRRDGAAIVHAV
ncbi:MAG TPA: ABC transporter ATP-binding protein [Xanthobacteraceae bacterium]|nr:ABC transporter ATP-binding protein [Xanthobacteraceae bacterium]